MRPFVLVSALAVLAASAFGQSYFENFEAGPPAFTSGSNTTFGNTPGGEPVVFPSGSWFARNFSTPIGSAGWFSNTTVFAPKSGDAMLNANFNSHANAGLINSWFMSPVTLSVAGDTISFWTRTNSNPTSFPDKLVLAVASFPTLNPDAFAAILEVNPGLSSTVYPAVWTQYSHTFAAFDGVGNGRFAFNYAVPNGGPSGVNADFIGIDDVRFTRGTLTEGFDSSTTVGFMDRARTNFGNPAQEPLIFPSGMWFAGNESVPIGSSGWFNGFNIPARSGPGRMCSDFFSSASDNISSYLFSPQRVFVNGDIIRFWTRTRINPSTFPDRLRLRLSTSGGSTDPVNFAQTLVTVNPLLTPTGYPATYTQYSATISGLSGPATGRFAFHYDVPGGGPTGNYADEIAIDDVEHIPAPASQFINGFVGLADTGSFPPGLTREITYQVRQAGNLIAAGKVIGTNPDFPYSIEVPFQARGACTITFDGSSFLKKNRTVTLDGTTQGLSTILFNGDVDQSGEVDAADIDAVIAAFGASFPGPGSPPNEDLDVSGEVDAADIDIAISNFGRTDD